MKFQRFLSVLFIVLCTSLTIKAQNTQLQNSTDTKWNPKIIKPRFEFHVGRPLVILDNVQSAYYIEAAFGFETELAFPVNAGLLLKGAYTKINSRAFLSGIQTYERNRRLTLSPRVIFSKPNSKLRLIAHVEGGIQSHRIAKNLSSPEVTSQVGYALGLGGMVQYGPISGGLSLELGDDIGFLNAKIGLTF